jgi:hypothetical protein
MFTLIDLKKVYSPPSSITVTLLCKFVIMAKAKKKRADKYDTKLAINGSFEDVIKVMVTPTKQEPKKVDKPKKK